MTKPTFIARGLRSAESVSPKHPDKICDQISDAILDAHLKEDKNARVAVDIAGGHGQVFVVGEVTSQAKNVNVAKIVTRLAGKVKLIENIVKQSPQIACGVDTGGAGDQGIMVGYACNETKELLPLEVVLARELNQTIFAQHPFDGKTQITLDKNNQIVGVVASFQNTSQSILLHLVKDWLAQKKQTCDNIFVNPCGDWTLGGFDADSGETGRKLAVDNYGPRIPVGGGAFSGKDPSKVDRSAAYMARHIAVAYLRRYHAQEVFVRLAYAIGVAQPIEATAIVDGVEKPIQDYDLSPNGIISHLNLKRPIYEQTARYGHFGAGFDWDK